MNPNLLFIILIVILLCGGGYGYRNGWGVRGISAIGVLVIILIVLLLTGWRP